MRRSKVHVGACQHSVQRKPWIPHLEAFAETHKRQRRVRRVFAATLVNKKKRSLFELFLSAAPKTFILLFIRLLIYFKRLK